MNPQKLERASMFLENAFPRISYNKIFKPEYLPHRIRYNKAFFFAIFGLGSAFLLKPHKD